MCACIVFTIGVAKYPGYPVIRPDSGYPDPAADSKNDFSSFLMKKLDVRNYFGSQNITPSWTYKNSYLTCGNRLYYLIKSTMITKFVFIFPLF